MNEKIPSAVWEGTFSIFGVPLRCYVLDNGERIINAEDMEALLAAMGAGHHIDYEALQMELDAFQKWRMSR